ncbi:TF3C6 factor, partial [Polyodon spathula]|nr:TF3C6 factor [Polyodon spathula]
LGTCVIFEENADHDLESEVKPQLKYKCHTVKKLMMKRTFLSEKKEGEEGSG